MCLAVNAAPLTLSLTGLCVIVCGMGFALIFSLDKRMPPTTWGTGSAKLAIIVLCAAAALATIVITASTTEGGYVFITAYRIDSVVATAWSGIAILLLSLYDTSIYNNTPEVVERRAARARQAQEEGKEPPKPPSTLGTALKKSVGPTLAIIVFCLYATVVPMSFQAARSVLEAMAIYGTTLVVFKTGGEFLLKKLCEKIRMPFFSLVVALFSFELVTSTQARILLAAYPDTSAVLVVSVLTAVFELSVRLFNLRKVRAEIDALKEAGVDKENVKLCQIKADIFTAVRFCECCDDAVLFIQREKEVGGRAGRRGGRERSEEACARERVERRRSKGGTRHAHASISLQFNILLPHTHTHTPAPPNPHTTHAPHHNNRTSKATWSWNSSARPLPRLSPTSLRPTPRSALASPFTPRALSSAARLLSTISSTASA